MLKSILSISGRPGLYKLVSQGKNMFVVESITPDKTRFPVYAHTKTTSLVDVSIYTDEAEVPLWEVLTSMKEKEQGAQVNLDLKKATTDDFNAYLAEVLPDFDRERVHASDIKKLISWYNILIAGGFTDFGEKEG